MVGYLFAGQGSQYIGMGKDLYDSFPESRTVFDKAQETLDFDLKKICFEGPEDLLKATRVSQPAILTVSIAAYEAFKAKLNIEPAFFAGLSLGEYTALVASGSLTLKQGLRLVKSRGQIMEEAAKKHPGKMAAILDLSLEQIKGICLKSGAEIANINAPGQIVISGRAEEVNRAKELCIAAGAKRVIELEVSGGFHSSLMSEAAAELRKVLKNTQILAPKIPVISNYTARPEQNAAEVVENLIYQMHSPVRWEESMRFLLSHGVDKFYEFGPGRVLKGLMRRIDLNAQVVSIEKKEDIDSALSTKK